MLNSSAFLTTPGFIGKILESSSSTVITDTGSVYDSCTIGKGLVVAFRTNAGQVNIYYWANGLAAGTPTASATNILTGVTVDPRPIRICAIDSTSILLAFSRDDASVDKIAISRINDVTTSPVLVDNDEVANLGSNSLVLDLVKFDSSRAILTMQTGATYSVSVWNYSTETLVGSTLTVSGGPLFTGRNIVVFDSTTAVLVGRATTGSFSSLWTLSSVTTSPAIGSIRSSSVVINNTSNGKPYLLDSSTIGLVHKKSDENIYISTLNNPTSGTPTHTDRLTLTTGLTALDNITNDLVGESLIVLGVDGNNEDYYLARVKWLPSSATLQIDSAAPVALSTVNISAIPNIHNYTGGNFCTVTNVGSKLELLRTI